MSKKWTVVVEITDETNQSQQSQIEQMVRGILVSCIPAGMKFQIFEITNAAYGPDGVILHESGLTVAKHIWNPNLKSLPILCKNCHKPLGSHETVARGLACKSEAVQS